MTIMNTTRRWLVGAVLVASIVPAQDGVAALARARVLEQQEGDLKGAEQAYRALLDASAAPAVQSEAALRLGTMLWRLEQKDAAKPLLERAVAAGGEVGSAAQAVLQGQGQSEKQAQERQARAAALVVKATNLLEESQFSKEPTPAQQEAEKNTERDLLWMGEPAAKALADRLREIEQDIVRLMKDAAQEMPAAIQVRLATMLVRLLWQIGTPAAQQFFSDIAANPEVVWRRVMVAPCDQAAADMLPAAARFLRDADPDGEVQHSVMALAGRFPIADIQALVADPLPQVRAAGFEGLQRRWQEMGVEERERVLKDVTSPLQVALRDPDPRPSRTAWGLMQQFAFNGPRAARGLVIAELAQWPQGLVFNLNGPGPYPLDDAELQLLLAAGRKLGPDSGNREDSHRTARDVVIQVLRVHEPEWTAAGIDAVLELVELGYGRDRSQDQHWQARLLALAQPAQLVRLVRALPKLSRANPHLQALSQRDLTADVFPAVREVVDGCLVRSPEGWRVFQQQGQNSRNGVQVMVQVAGPELDMLLRIVGCTRAPAAPDWLSQLVDRYPALVDPAAMALVQLSVAGVGEPARAAMRKLLVWEGTPEVELNPRLRCTLFAELARLGDVPAIPLFPRAYALGVSRGRHPFEKDQGLATGVRYLGNWRQPNGSPGVPWHGYDDDHLTAAWRTLLRSDQRDKVVADVAQMGIDVPLAAVLPFTEVLPAVVVATTKNEQRNTPNQVLQVFSLVGSESVAEGTPLREALRKSLQDQSIAEMLIGHLQPSVLRVFEVEVHAALAQAKNPGTLLDSITRAGVTLSADDWLRQLRQPSPVYRQAAFGCLPTKVEPAVLREVEARLQDEEPGVRIAACSALARFLSPDSVTPLLQALRDSQEQVRTAAADALQRIRFFQDQQTHWQNVQAGVEIGKDSAAAKLVLQAKPGAAKDQRLLAIRSLAVLGAPEAQPYLIEWSQDPDAEIAAAARAAVAKIHQTAGVK